MENNNTENWQDIGPISMVQPGDYTITKINHNTQELEIAVFNINNQFFAIENRCPHQNLPLADGPLDEYSITCPFHGAVFSVKTGIVEIPPGNPCDNLIIFPVKIENDIIKIKIIL